MAAVLDEVTPAVFARMGYVEPQRARPYDYAVAPPPGAPWQNYRPDPRPVRIADARMSSATPALDREGFMLVSSESLLRDFLDEAAVKAIYYAEVAELARTALNGARALVFDHLVRQREAGSALGFGRRVAGERPSANGRVHTDYTLASGPRRMQQLIGEQAQPARYAIVNVWRPLAGPVRDAPLALCDARSVAAGDLVASDVHYADRTGEIYLVTHAPAHRWFYYPQMQPHEALVFKQFDSDAGAPRFVPHAAFDHPDTPADAPLRSSIEARVLVLFDR